MAVSLHGELAKLYSEVSGIQKEHGKELIEKLSLEKNMKILDLGCGTGYLSSMMADCVGPEGKVVAIDPNRSRLDIAEKQYSRSNLVFLEANDVTLPEDQYDLVFATYVLHWIQNKTAVFNKVYQNLKPGGRFAFTVPENRAPFFQKMDKLMGPDFETRIEQVARSYLLSTSEYNDLATTTGFKVISTQVETKPLNFANVEDLLKWYYGSTEGQFNPDKVDPASLEEFKQSFGDRPVESSFPVITIILSKL